VEVIFDPSIWVGLLTLVVLEIVLGIDNLLFVAVLAEKLPPHQRDMARKIGLSLALIMRLGLLAAISWMVTLVEPLVTLGTLEFSGRDLILIGGGLFLVFKATMELHERLEGTVAIGGAGRVYAGFWMVVSQIIVLDAVFSLDAVITAVGMVNELWVMMLAVVIAMTAMIVASKPLTTFVSAHPTVVVLCLGFLLMIGFSLISDGFGLHIPKGYLYGAIGFSILVETLNQVAQRNAVKEELKRPMRERTAEAILRLMGGRQVQEGLPVEAEVSADLSQDVFAEEERYMISGVLTLADRSIRRIMTPRVDISFVDVEWAPDKIRAYVRESPHSLLPVCRESLDNLIGVISASGLFAALEEGADLVEAAEQNPPVLISDKLDAMRVLDTLRNAKGSLVFVVDEFGTVQGLVTPLDVLEAIAGDFPDADETPDIEADAYGWLAKGSTDLYQLEQTLGVHSLVRPEDDYLTLAGLLLAQNDSIPRVGDAFQFGDLHFQVVEATRWKIDKVRISRLPPESARG